MPPSEVLHSFPSPFQPFPFFNMTGLYTWCSFCLKSDDVFVYFVSPLLRQNHKLLEGKVGLCSVSSIYSAENSAWHVADSPIHTCRENDMKEHGGAILQRGQETPLWRDDIWTWMVWAEEVTHVDIWETSVLIGPSKECFFSPLWFWMWQELNELADVGQDTTFIIYLFLLHIFIEYLLCASHVLEGRGAVENKHKALASRSLLSVKYGAGIHTLGLRKCASQIRHINPLHLDHDWILIMTILQGQSLFVP